jgi:hypothetical protein
MQINGRVVLGENVSSTQTGVTWKGGRGMFMAVATFSGGTVKLQMLLTDGAGTANWIDVKNQAGSNVSLTAAGAIPFELPPCQLRVNITTATVVYAYAVGMHQ